MEALTPWHLLLILLGFMLLFGYKKLPDATRSIGRSLRIFKSEMRDLSGDDQRQGAAPAEPEPPALPGPSPADRWEAEAAAAEARAAELRARAAGTAPSAQSTP